MKSLSISFTLGKSSGSGGANIEHNHREYIASNVDASRICDNIVYANQDVREAYRELFGEALAEYNDKQKRADRKIDDYFTHIHEGKREESFYEAIVQLGDSHVAGVGTPGGELATKMLDEYMRGFANRNPNLHVFSATLHLDEASPHIHIDFIPFYTEPRKNSLSKGVSMRAALDEQGFSNTNKRKNSLVAWEESEFAALEAILKRHGLTRDIKRATHEHESVEGYKALQDEAKITATNPWQATNSVEQLQAENNLLRSEKEKLTSEKHSPWRSFFYSVPEKQSYVQAELTRLQIPFRETENGFEAQACYVEQIRKLEKEFKPSQTSNRDTLRDELDRIIMQSQSYDDILQRLRDSGYEVKQGKYIAVKPKDSSGFIRLKSLGEDYSEQAIRNRLTHKSRFESNINNQIDTAATKGDTDSLYVMTYKTIRHYTITFAAGVLPMKRIRKKKPFSWENCAELNRLAELNKRINAGATLTTLRNEFAALEKSVAEKEARLLELKKELALYRDLYNRGERCFKFMSESESDLSVLAEHRITTDNYERIMELVVEDESEIAALEQSLPDERRRLRDTADTLVVFEKIASGTYVQSLIDDEKQRRQPEYIANGTKRVN